MFAVALSTGAWAYTASDYSQDGLLHQCDAIANVNAYTHDASATVWKDLAGGLDANSPFRVIGAGAADTVFAVGSLALSPSAGTDHRLPTRGLARSQRALRSRLVRRDGEEIFRIYDWLTMTAMCYENKPS